MELMIEGVNKSFKNKHVVSDINLILNEGVHGLLGANGSGKTTLFRILCGLLKSDGDGIVTFDGIDMKTQYDTYVSNIGYMPQHFGYYPNYTVKEFLRYMGVVKGLKKSYLKQRIIKVLTMMNLKDKQNMKMKNLSGGMLRRVGIAQALLNEPKLLILDEPTAGLDPKERIVFRNLLASLSKTTIILLSTHIVSDIEHIADDILVMKEGEIFLHDDCETLLDTMMGKVWEITTSTAEGDYLLQRNVVVNSHHYTDGVTLRVISNVKPCSQAIYVAPNLDDLYLYHFEKEGIEDVPNHKRRI